MCPVKKAGPAKKHGSTRKWMVALAAVLLIALIVGAAYLWVPGGNKPADNQQNSRLTAELNIMPSGFKSLAQDYLGVMKNLNSSQTKTKMAAMLNPAYNQTDLFRWETSKMSFANDPAGWFEDPFQILNRGMGICVQWSIVYVSACLALGYPSRLVVAVDTTSWTYIHTWAEDYYHGSWVHVDPSDRVWNDPSRYLGPSWDWGKYIGSTVRVYAFEDGSFQDVTATYSAH